MYDKKGAHNTGRRSQNSVIVIVISVIIYRLIYSQIATFHSNDFACTQYANENRLELSWMIWPWIFFKNVADVHRQIPSKFIQYIVNVYIKALYLCTCYVHENVTNIIRLRWWTTIKWPYSETPTSGAGPDSKNYNSNNYSIRTINIAVRSVSIIDQYIRDGPIRGFSPKIGTITKTN